MMAFTQYVKAVVASLFLAAAVSIVNTAVSQAAYSLFGTGSREPFSSSTAIVFLIVF